MLGPCDWTLNVPDACLSSWNAATQGQRDAATRVATQVFWAATGRRFGLCARTVRPCWRLNEPLYQAYPVGSTGEGYWSLQGVPGGVVLLGGTCCASGCSCAPPEVILPGAAASVTTVVIDGVLVDPSTYRLDDGSRLVRLNGLGWPASQDLALPTTEDGTWYVTYSDGAAVPPVLADAAGAYACQLVLGMTGSGQCRLPNRVRSVTRQGVEIEYVSMDTWLEDGLTGVADFDQVILSFNPKGLARPVRFLSPDLPTYR